MLRTKRKESSSSRSRSGHFFQKSEDMGFFGGQRTANPFFKAAGSRDTSKGKSSFIQRQPKGGQPSSGGGTPAGSNRAASCPATPRYPNWGCFTRQLRLDVEDNLRLNGHHLLRVAALQPHNTALHWETFQKYAVGANLLETTFGFMGAGETLRSRLALGTGLGYKLFNFSQTGLFELNLPVSVGRGVNLEFQFNLESDPDNLRDVRRVDGMIGISATHDLF